MEKQSPHEIAEEIKSKIVRSCEFVDEKNVRITNDMSKYHGHKGPNGFTNRNAGTGEVATWVLVEVPEIPQIRSDEYYQKNEHLTKPTEESVEKAKEQSRMIEAVCEAATKPYQNVDYIGYNTPSEGFDSSDGRTRYVNIRVNHSN